MIEIHACSGQAELQDEIRELVPLIERLADIARTYCMQTYDRSGSIGKLLADVDKALAKTDRLFSGRRI